MPPTEPTFKGALDAARHTEVTLKPYPAFKWRLRRVSTAQMAEVGAAIVLSQREDAASPNDAVSPVRLAKHRSLTDAVVAAGVVAIDFAGGWRDVGEGTGLQLVTTAEESCPDEGRFLPTEDFPPGCAALLMGEILTLHQDAGGAAKRIATFLGLPADS